MERKKYNIEDLRIWEKVFEMIPEEWKQVNASDSMQDCLKYLNRCNVKSVLDLGCGIGIWSMFLSKAGFKVKGVDFSSNAIAYAKDWTKKENQTIEFYCSPISSLSFIKEKFEGIVAAKILDIISKKELKVVKKQINLYLKNGGVLFCLFNPIRHNSEPQNTEKVDNPTKGITLTDYTDEELVNLFRNFNILNFKRYKHGFRGLLLQKG